MSLSLLQSDILPYFYGSNVNSHRTKTKLFLLFHAISCYTMLHFYKYSTVSNVWFHSTYFVWKIWMIFLQYSRQFYNNSSIYPFLLRGNSHTSSNETLLFVSPNNDLNYSFIWKSLLPSSNFDWSFTRLCIANVISMKKRKASRYFTTKFWLGCPHARMPHREPDSLHTHLGTAACTFHPEITQSELCPHTMRLHPLMYRAHAKSCDFRYSTRKLCYTTRVWVLGPGGGSNLCCWKPLFGIPRRTPYRLSFIFIHLSFSNF